LVLQGETLRNLNRFPLFFAAKIHYNNEYG